MTRLTTHQMVMAALYHLVGPTMIPSGTSDWMCKECGAIESRCSPSFTPHEPTCPAVIRMNRLEELMRPYRIRRAPKRKKP